MYRDCQTIHFGPLIRGNMALAEGTIGFISVKPIPEEKQKPNAFGKTPTHRISFVLQEKEGVWFSLPPATRDHAQVKYQGNWVPLNAGDKIEFRYVENNGFNNVKTSDISVVEKAKQQPTIPEGEKPAHKSSSSPAQAKAIKKTYSRKVSSGDLIGHAVKCVCNMGVRPDDPKFIDTAKQVYDLTAGLKNAYAEKHPELSEYEKGAPIGMSVEKLTAMGYSLSDIPEGTKDILAAQADLKEYIESGGNPQEFSWDTIGTNQADEPNDEPEAPDDESENENEEEQNEEFFDDIPF